MDQLKDKYQNNTEQRTSMKMLILIFLLLTTSINAKELGFTCSAQNPTKPEDKIFFNIILDTNSYHQENKSVDIILYHLAHHEESPKYFKVSAFYVSPSETNPQFYIKAKNVPYYQHSLDFVIYPLAEKMLGYSNVTISKNGKHMDGTCERADFLDNN